MTDATANGDGLALVGLDAANPLGFLAVLGTLRSLSVSCPEREIKMGWRRFAGGWRPVILASEPLQGPEVVERLTDAILAMAAHPAFTIGDDLAVSPEVFRIFVESAARDSSPSDRSWADFAAAFGCETAVSVINAKKNPVIQDTAFRTMSGAGHQHFVAFMRYICGEVTGVHLEKVLFEPWRYDDPTEKRSMRWDPRDDSRYALRWRDPSGDPTRRQGGSMLGANALAITGLPLLPTMPAGRWLATTGFRGRGSRNTFWTWPVWERPLGVDAVRSTLALSDIQETNPPATVLSARGIVAVYRSQRLTIGKFRGFAPAEAI